MIYKRYQNPLTSFFLRVMFNDINLLHSKIIPSQKDHQNSAIRMCVTRQVFLFRSITLQCQLPWQQIITAINCNTQTHDSNWRVGLTERLIRTSSWLQTQINNIPLIAWTLKSLLCRHIILLNQFIFILMSGKSCFNLKQR